MKSLLSVTADTKAGEKEVSGETLAIRGGRPLTGRVEVKGAKTLATKAMVAALLGETTSILRDVPGISDVQVVILGTSTDAGTLGVWQTDYRDKRNTVHTVDEKLCLLSVVRVLSAVFDEKVPLTTIPQAVSALWPKQTKNAENQFDAHLLSLWLNVADGSIALSDLVDADGDGTADSTVGAVIQAGEAARTAANPSQSALTSFKNLFEAINAAA